VSARRIALAGAALLLAGCTEAPAPADLILRNGRIVTLDPARAEVAALAAREGRIVAVGDDAEIDRFRGASTRVIDLAGRLAVPGFIEGHGHFVGLGEALMHVDLGSARTFDEMVSRVAAAAREAPPGSWIEGRGWHQEKWDAPVEPSVEGYPVHDALSRAVPDHPVLLEHASGHAVLVNARALELAGIDATTPDPPGGTILRFADGRPTGVLRETATAPVDAALGAALDALGPEQARARRRRAIDLAAAECLAKGVTSFQDAGSDFGTIDQLRELAEAGELPLRLWVMIGEDNDGLERKLDDYRWIGVGDDHLTVRAIKRYIDGALGSHGAWLLAPYSDLPESSGLNTTPIATLERTAQLAVEHGFQLCIHAIGDRANREVLDLYERTFAAHPDARDLRWRIEHAQHLDPADIPRFAELGVVASMQTVHCTSDAPWVPLRLGPERAEQGAYVWRSLIDSGAVVSNGTDTPVEDVSPVRNFYAAVTRRIPGGGAFFAEQRMTRQEALESMTIRAAWAAFEDDVKGSLEPGKLADVVVLDRDILRVPDDEIPGARPLYTIVGGKVLYASDDGR